MTTEKTDQITTELAKINVTKTVLAKLKTDYLPLKIKDINDKEGYKKVHEARMECRDLRVKTEKACKLGREEALKTQKQWLAKEKEIVGEISEVEQYLKKQEDAIDSQIEANKIRAERLLKLLGRKEQIVGIESYLVQILVLPNTDKSEITDEMIMVYDDPTWNNLILMAKDKKITEFEEKERKQKKEEQEKILTQRTNELIAVGGHKKANGIWGKGNYFLTEESIIGFNDEVWKEEIEKVRVILTARDVFAEGGVKRQLVEKLEGESLALSGKYENAQFPGAGGKELSDEEKLFNYASALEKVYVPEMETERGKKQLSEGAVMLDNALFLLRQ